MKKINFKSTANFIKVSGLTLLMGLGMVACNDDDSGSTTPEPNDNNPKNRQVTFEATDAPLDNAEVYGAFVTVSEVWVNGEKVEGFNNTTFELSALTDGKTETMEIFETEAESINQVIFKLDFENDEDGQTPGTYVLKADGSKDMMMSTSDEVVINKSFDLDAETSNNIVFDFDLRKMVREESNGDYELVASSDLNSSVRAVARSNSGMIDGSINDENDNLSDKAIVYIYKEGTYDATEIQGDGNTKLQFSNAINSAEVDANGNFSLNFIEDEGMYELYLFNYNDIDRDGRFEVSGMSQLLINGETSLSGASLSGGAEVDLSIDLKTILPL